MTGQPTEPVIDMEAIERVILARLRNDAPEWTEEQRRHVATHLVLDIDTAFQPYVESD